MKINDGHFVLQCFAAAHAGVVSSPARWRSLCLQVGAGDNVPTVRRTSEKLVQAVRCWSMLAILVCKSA